MPKLKITERDLTEETMGESLKRGSFYMSIAHSFRDGICKLNKMRRSGDYSDLSEVAEDLDNYYTQLLRQAEEFRQKLEDLGCIRCPECGEITKTYKDNGSQYTVCCSESLIEDKD